MHQSFENLDSFSEAMSKEDEYSIILLRTHLLIEEKLREYLSSVFINKNSLKKANLTFSQVMRLAEGITDKPELKWFWDAIIMLNKIRNDMAHNINANLDQDKLASLIEHIDKVGMSHINPEGKRMLHPIKGRLAFIYSLACTLVDDDTGFLIHNNV